MSKFSVNVPVEGKREALLSYFNDGQTKFLFSLEAYTSVEGAAEDATDATVEALGLAVAEQVLLSEMPWSNLECDFVDGAYEITSDGEQLGWEVVVYTRPYDDYGLDEDCVNP